MAEGSRRTQKSRRQRARERVEELLGTNDEREGVDARGRGDDRQGVSARGYDVDEDAVAGASSTGDSWADGVPVSEGPDRGPSARERVREAASRGAAAAKARASEKASKASLAAALREVAAEGGGEPSGSRNRELVKRAERAGHIKNPTPTSLRAMGDSVIVSEMARADSGAEATLIGGGSMLSFEGEEMNDGVGVSAEGLGLGLDFEMGGDDGDSGDADGDAFEFDDPFGLSGGDR